MRSSYPTECRWAKANRKPDQTVAAPPSSRFTDNWPDTGTGARAPNGVLTWTGEPVKTKWPDPPRPKGKLDT